MLEFIGALLRFFGISIAGLISGKPTESFSDFFKSKKGQIENVDRMAADGIIGFIFLILLLVAIYFLNT
tara:strand:- start:110 stop:316 length:207 start_codon:yes stop_codon:yes gene_type:complete